MHFIILKEILLIFICLIDTKKVLKIYEHGIFSVLSICGGIFLISILYIQPIDHFLLNIIKYLFPGGLLESWYQSKAK